MSHNNSVNVTHIYKQFGNKTAVKDISFTIKQGEIFGLLGPNGAGKTTIIRMMTTLLHQDTG